METDGEIMKTCVTYVSLEHITTTTRQFSLPEIRAPATKIVTRKITFAAEPQMLGLHKEHKVVKPGKVSMGNGPRAPVTVRVHDSGRGCAARGVPVCLAMRAENSDTWETLEEGVTNSEGCIAMLYHVTLPYSASYRLEVDSDAYFEASGQDSCCQKIQTTFRLPRANQYHLVSVHLSPAGYSLHLG